MLQRFCLALSGNFDCVSPADRRPPLHTLQESSVSPNRLSNMQRAVLRGDREVVRIEGSNVFEVAICWVYNR
jgi:hypothetical protein